MSLHRPASTGPRRISPTVELPKGAPRRHPVGRRSRDAAGRGGGEKGEREREEVDKRVGWVGVSIPWEWGGGWAAHVGEWDRPPATVDRGFRFSAWTWARRSEK